jgi:hypothetical protein
LRSAIAWERVTRLGPDLDQGIDDAGAADGYDGGHPENECFDFVSAAVGELHRSRSGTGKDADNDQEYPHHAIVSVRPSSSPAAVCGTPPANDSRVSRIPSSCNRREPVRGCPSLWP